MAEASELLRSMAVLRGVPPEELEVLPVERVERAPGQPFFSQGDPGDSVYGVLTGRVRIAKSARDGREVCLEVLGPGDIIAAVAVIRRCPMPATAVALERTACLRVPGDAFQRLRERHPVMAQRMLDVLSRRLLESGCSRLCLATEPVEVRMASALMRLADKFGAVRGGELAFSQRFTRKNLADLAGTTVESAIRVMSRWTRDGLIQSSAGRITILQPEAMRRLAERPASD
ncbi:Crp/Fnr family transcriptional regulator [Myxococcus sp. RHSTA-1-4]|uniref:Crp/Fnr family transcriptional regulator n=1 Tax=Myxococcus sp. RHSTA-1-4 TaxID=2874601 RepID=UPI001CC13A1C|nr:Crp/Fnr family transcriptional regulator [Myxococcus sp. RHSTA-1-4]MBZ4421963.1 Crp/Fnr family transcriptional regulator [Myxococcus sp. RHSTA-1-4]